MTGQTSPNVPARIKTHCVAVLNGTYGEDRVRVRQLGRDSRFPGRWVTAGSGYAGRLAYSEQAKAMAIMECDARFNRWEVPAHGE